MPIPSLARFFVEMEGEGDGDGRLVVFKPDWAMSIRKR
jgi:hypothetical protein